MNGALSNGPVTEEGKRRSSANAVRHGLLAQSIVLQNECRDSFDELLQQHISHFSQNGADDLTGTELSLIETLAAADWRMRRLWAIENRLMDEEISTQSSGDEVSRITHAFTRLAESNQLALLNRYEGSLRRAFGRIYRSLEESRKRRRRNEPTL